jgi:hypothetical protein
MLGWCGPGIVLLAGLDSEWELSLREDWDWDCVLGFDLVLNLGCEGICGMCLRLFRFGWKVVSKRVCWLRL